MTKETSDQIEDSSQRGRFWREALHLGCIAGWAQPPIGVEGQGLVELLGLQRSFQCYLSRIVVIRDLVLSCFPGPERDHWESPGESCRNMHQGDGNLVR